MEPIGRLETSTKITTTRCVMTQKSTVLEEKACFEIPIAELPSLF